MVMEGEKVVSSGEWKADRVGKRLREMQMEGIKRDDEEGGKKHNLALGGAFEQLMRKEEYFSRALYTFDIGQNDLTAGYFANMSMNEVKAYVPDLLNELSSIIKNIYGQGGRSFWIHNTSPVGCLSYILDCHLITAGQIDKVGCASLFNDVARYLNHGLKKIVAKLRKDLKFAAITYVDVYARRFFHFQAHTPSSSSSLFLSKTYLSELASTASFTPAPPRAQSIYKWREGGLPIVNLSSSKVQLHSSNKPKILLKERISCRHSSTSLQSPTISKPNDIDNFDNSVVRVFVEEPPWMSSFLSIQFQEKKKSPAEVAEEEEVNKYKSLRKRQIKIETEAWERTAEEYREFEREMCEKKLAPNLPYVKALFLGWFEPLKQAIAKEQKFQETKRQKAGYAYHIGLLPADKMAVIVMHKLMGLLMTGHDDGCVRVVQAAIHVGKAIEQEVRIHNFLERTKRFRSRKKTEGEHESVYKKQEILRKNVKNLIKKQKLKAVQKLLKSEDGTNSWGRDAQAKLGSRLIQLLIETAFVQPPVNQLPDDPPEIRPAFKHTFKTIRKEPGGRGGYRHGVIECDELVRDGLDKTARHMVIPYVPMLIPPRKWKGYERGGHLFLPSYVMRTHGAKEQQDAVKKVPGKQMQKVFEALDTLGRTKWRVNKKVLMVVEKFWESGGNVAGLVDRADVSLPEKPLSEDAMEIQKWRWSVRKVKKCNRERHAQRCDIELKLSVAQRIKDEEGFYYPHNLDFRGRAYPMHPHLNHLSSDLCRGVLEFAEGRPLGEAGLRWLKIHLANLYAGGVEKLSYDGRMTFVENHLYEILDSADKPIDGRRWWLNAEDPFQCLAACHNLAEALRSSSPHNVISHLPIHQDGSCNGLQHYAALGRDSLEAAAVNLVAGERPSDVYSEIAARVLDIMKRDCKKDPATFPGAVLAKILIGQVDRKLVKQTVMTSVYGVTYIGAREQIKRRLEERGEITDDRVLFGAACYAAKVTLTALGQMFQAARGIMGWLGDCAKVIASENEPVRWTTPLGLPVVQPYRKTKRYQVITSLQVLALQREGDFIEVKRQRTAFPPNFVHSLDGSHMMMTAIACRDAGLHFAGVHDSFWTHACDVDKMNRILRDKFVELYNIPILENLLESFQTSFPTLSFPPLPDTGEFDLEQVLESPYFFN